MSDLAAVNLTETRDVAACTRRHPIVAGTALGAGGSALVGLVLLAVGALGAPVQVVTGAAPDGADLTAVEVVLTAGIAVALGGVLLWALDRFLGNALRTWSWVVVAVAVVSAIPLWGLDVSLESKLVLTVMHLATGAITIWAQRAVRHGRPQS
jgi:hypothetical protein